ncbi:3,4-dihydroxy-2-butanone 4-phosphate synthase [Thalictrum thalictroides]|uniref:GTP cyclohydrolase II n=1 Tax=Thalictrum thalictroides TaxID=46969 RepID=A0A7J6V9L0_THATH|nr:3,4-dihydroxy-2-butanone 4-phosphate synthase [Thalictrum thalictroides]
MAFNVSVEELKSFHIIDQELYARFTTELHHNPNEVMQVMSFWLWLEEAGYPSIIEVLRSLSDDAINAVYEEAITCLRCMESDNPPSEGTSDGDSIPITYNSLLNGEVSLAILYENRALVLDGLSKILAQVCTQVFEDIGQDEAQTNLGPTVDPFLKQFRLGGQGRIVVQQNERPGGQLRMPNIPFIRYGLHPAFRPLLHFNGIGAMPIQGQPIVPSSFLGFGLKGPAPEPTVESNFEVGESSNQAFNTQAQSRSPNAYVPPEGRGLFMTFSRGYAITEEELSTYLLRTYGDVVERIHMENPQTAGAQPMYAIVAFRSRAIVNNILNGRPRFMFKIKGKHHPFLPRIFVNFSGSNHLLSASPCLVIGFKRNSLLSYGCQAVNVKGVGGDFLDEASVIGNQNGLSTFRTLDAEITQETIDFFVSDAEGDPDCPTDGFSSIEHALNTLRQGKFVIAVDDENDDVEGNLIMAASLTNPQAMSFMVKHGSGIISVGMKETDLERLDLPLMSPSSRDEDPSAPANTIPVDAKVGVSTGVSAADRAQTVLALSSSHTRPEDFRRPGHVFPLKYRNGGVLSRVGHTEASVDLVSLAGLPPISVFSAIVDAEDGSIASFPYLRKMALDFCLPIVSISDLIRYRRKREKLVERTAVSRLPTKWGQFEAYSYRSKLDGTEHVALVKGSIGNGQDILVRVHSECLTGDIFGSARCDCGNQLALAMQLIEQAGRGVVVYLRGHEGRGIGLGHKLQAYNLQDRGHDTVEANIELGFAADARDYGIGAQILRDLGARTMRLMTNNPAKFTGLKGYGLAVVGRVPVLSPITEENKRYLETKRTKMGHIYGSDLLSSVAGFDENITDQAGEDKQSG